MKAKRSYSYFKGTNLVLFLRTTLTPITGYAFYTRHRLLSRCVIMCIRGLTLAHAAEPTPFVNIYKPENYVTISHNNEMGGGGMALDIFRSHALFVSSSVIPQLLVEVLYMSLCASLPTDMWLRSAACLPQLLLVLLILLLRQGSREYRLVY